MLYICPFIWRLGHCTLIPGCCVDQGINSLLQHAVQQTWVETQEGTTNRLANGSNMGRDSSSNWRSLWKVGRKLSKLSGDDFLCSATKSLEKKRIPPWKLGSKTSRPCIIHRWFSHEFPLTDPFLGCPHCHVCLSNSTQCWWWNFIIHHYPK